MTDNRKQKSVLTNILEHQNFYLEMLRWDHTYCLAQCHSWWEDWCPAPPLFPPSWTPMDASASSDM